MCVAQTAKRRRKQIAIDKRYRKRDPMAAARRDERRKVREQQMAGRKQK
jgi:hypothetical protein